MSPAAGTMPVTITSSLREVSVADFPGLDRSFSEFMQLLESRGLAKRSLMNYRFALDNLKEAGKDLHEIRAEDLVALEKKLRERYKASTVALRRLLISSFLQYALIGPDAAMGQYPECVTKAWRRSKRHKALSESFGMDKVTKGRIHVKDLKEIIKVMGLPEFGESRWVLRNKAMFAFLWDSGARRSEAIEVKLKDLRLEGQHAVVVLGGKTGTRRVPLAWCVPYLKRWLDSHPFRDNLDAAPFCTSMSTGFDKDTMWTKWRKVKKILTDRGYKLEPETSLHSFRHGRAQYAKTRERLSDEQMRVFFGWAPGSKMPSRYGGEAEVTDAVLNHWGIETGTPEKGELPRLICGDCGADNLPEANFCAHCGSALTEKGAEMKEERREDVKQTLIDIVRKEAAEPGVLYDVISGLIDDYPTKQVEPLKPKKRG